MHENPNSRETQTLLAAARTGDRSSLQALLQTHSRYLERVVDLRMDSRLRTRLDTSDIVQRASFEALRRIGDYADNPVIPLRLWLRRIACDQLVMAQRRHVGARCRSVSREVPLPERSSLAIAHQLVSGLTTPSVRLERKEIACQVREAMAQLAENDREILLLHNFEGLTSTESAHVLGIEPAAARKRYGRALRRLKELLEQRGLGASKA